MRKARGSHLGYFPRQDIHEDIQISIRISRTCSQQKTEERERECVLYAAFAKDFSGKSQPMRTYRAERTYGVDSGKWSESSFFYLLYYRQQGDLRIFTPPLGAIRCTDGVKFGTEKWTKFYRYNVRDGRPHKLKILLKFYQISEYKRL